MRLPGAAYNSWIHNIYVRDFGPSDAIAGEIEAHMYLRQWMLTVMA